MSVCSKICDQGNRVVFDGQGGFIENKSGIRTSFKRENNVYVLEMHAKKPGELASGLCSAEQVREGPSSK